MITIAVDFDGTIAEHRYPDIGRPVPGALAWLERFRSEECRLILLTMRGGVHLAEAVGWCRQHGITFDHVNENPSQRKWTDSQKVYAHLYIDDAAVGCPLRESAEMGARAMVDWSIVGPHVLRVLEERRSRGNVV